MERPSAPRRIGYVLLWFPLSSETFVFREVVQLRAMGLPVHVYTLYDTRLKGLSKEMRGYAGPVTRMGVRRTFALAAAFARELVRHPREVLALARDAVFHRMRTLETRAENTWSFFAGFYLAERAKADGIELLHAPWANGPATAAWVASRLTGIPFAFTGRAGDIYPEDGILHGKARDAAFIRTNNAANLPWLRSFCPPKDSGKVHLVYNSLTLTASVDCKCPCQQPYRLLAIGRFVPKKGFTYLLGAVARLLREGFPVQLTLVGDGSLHRQLVRQIRDLGIADAVTMPGFVPHDQILSFMENHDMLVMPSIIAPSFDRDGIPNVIMEALSNGMPVIATDVSGISEVIRHKETGILLQQKDAAGIADAVRWIAGHREQALAMGARGRSLVFSMFDAKTNIRRLYDLYNGDGSAADGNNREAQ